ncbi:hypothetical protein N7493_005298 [Penicillium malachiteum]|uniref:Kievitone hydratase n=1 Tax=Penicillium malachiteum TaxID=1324776 RepID=A0AAD6HMN8_9EURO|nr:hypothetical protein N7493_005298 [Penicillium malachiteum]
MSSNLKPMSDIPVLFNFSSSQFANTLSGNAATSSYWTSSYITGTNREQYFVVSHILISAENTTLYSASILDLNHPENYHSCIASSNESVMHDGSILKATFDGNGFESLTEDNVSQMRTFSNCDGVKFNMTYNATSMALVDGGTGLFTFGNGESYEWGFPSCYTEGTVTASGKEVVIDPKNSFTWYDRQWNDGLPSNGNWTWFELHILESKSKLSIWAIDDEEPHQRYRFATIRTEDGSQNVVPVTFTPDYTRHWYSNASDTLYALDWTVAIGSFATLRISSITKDQEITGPAGATGGYEGFVTLNGDFNGESVDGFGLVEIAYV